ncbi:MAG: 2Fe-2S iron-sulfur cluster-binding protein, partial [Erysipelotrichaceae bacterium]|nr:2Fe-2S iron-sulfur cluster-binding protein [Erysipelotrichaceae bacterium]
MISLEINSKKIQVEEGSTILEAARKLDIKIPTLCHMDLHDIKFVNKHASCRVCMVEQEGSDKLIPACATFVKEGMKIRTDTAKAVKSRRTMVELLLSDHPNTCLTCAKNLDCELQQLARDLGIRKIKYQGEQGNYEIDNNSYSIVRDANKCILCKRCETMCNEIQTVGALTDVGR